MIGSGRSVAAALLLVVASAAGAQTGGNAVGNAVTETGSMIGTATKSAVDSTASLVNANPREIPQVLQDAVLRPYTLNGAANCAQITASVKALTAVLGNDVDVPVPAGTSTTSTDIAMAAGQSAVGMFIPGTGLIRQLSGAAAAQKRAQTAVYAGSIRRGFLKGLGQAKRCAPPASPLPAALR